MASLLYNRGKEQLLRDGWEGGTYKVMLVGAGYSPSVDDDFVQASGAHAAELSGTGYVAGFNGSGRHTLAGKTALQDDTNDRAVATATDPVWNGIDAGTAAGMIIIKEVTNDTDSILIAYIDIPDTTTIGTTITVNLPAFSAGGIFFI